MMTSVSAILLFAAAAAPTRAPEPRERAEAYYYYSLGHQARLAGSADEALAEYRKAQKADPKSGEIRAEIARTLREAGKSEEALPRPRRRCGSIPTASTPTS
jgi:tetratricopeptide (TPR) repeat protein